LITLVADASNNVCKGDVLTDIGNLDGGPFSLFSISGNDNEATFDSRDSVPLLADVVDFDSPLFTLYDRWFLWF
jgi:hypothetical protein